MSIEKSAPKAASAAKPAGKVKNKNIKIFGLNLFIDGGFDIIFMFIVFALLTTGLIMMFSASYVWAKYNVSDTGGNTFHYITRQLVFAVIGVIAMFVLSKVNPQVIKGFMPVIAAVSLALLVVVLFYHTNVPDSPDIKRWIPIGSFSFQPSDVAKLGLIITMAALIERNKKKLEKNPFFPFAIAAVVVVFCGLVYLESHLSCVLLMLIIGVGMMFLGGIDRRFFIVCGIAAVVIIAILWHEREHISFLNGYQIKRITSFFVDEKNYYDTDDRYQTNQSLFALGSGGLLGVGLGNSRQKFMYLPEPQNDFVFAIVGEELGFIRCVLILLMFMALIAKGFHIAVKAKNTYERLLVLGICLQFGVQTILNILVVTDMMPNTGISLPFFSYGGTALVIQLAEMGLVLGVSRTGDRFPKRKKVKDEGERHA